MRTLFPVGLHRACRVLECRIFLKVVVSRIVSLPSVFSQSAKATKKMRGQRVRHNNLSSKQTAKNIILDVSSCSQGLGTIPSN